MKLEYDQIVHMTTTGSGELREKLFHYLLEAGSQLFG